MKKPVLLLVVALSSGAPVSAVAQSASDELDIRHQPWPRREAFAGVTTSGGRSGSWSANRFYVIHLGKWPNTTHYWVARRASGESFGPTAGQTAIVWADSRSCPALERALLQLENLPAAWIDVPRLGREDQRWSWTLDGVHHRLWSTARDARTGLAMSLVLEGNVNTPIERWWTEALRRLEGCWTTATPSES